MATAETKDDSNSIAQPLAIATTKDKSESNANLPLFRLPRELRDKIYDLIVLSERNIHYVLALERGKRPRITIFAVTSKASHACHQMKVEYTSAVVRHVKKLVKHQTVGGLLLDEPGPHCEALKKNISQLEITQTRASNAEFNQLIQAIKISVTIRDALVGVATLLLTFTFPSFKKFESHQHLKILWRTELRQAETFKIPPHLTPSLQWIAKTVKAVNWKGSLREYMLWQSYFVRYVRKSLVEKGAGK